MTATIKTVERVVREWAEAQDKYWEEKLSWVVEIRQSEYSGNDYVEFRYDGILYECIEYFQSDGYPTATGKDFDDFIWNRVPDGWIAECIRPGVYGFYQN